MTDPFSSGRNTDLSQDYFQFSEGPVSGNAEGSFVSQIPFDDDRQSQQIQQPNQRLPASQPSSPVRGIFTHQYAPQIAGRQRGATFSGGSFYNFGQSNPSPFTFTQAVASQGIPSQFSFPALQSPIDSPLAPSPTIATSASHLQGDGNALFGSSGQQQQNGHQQQLGIMTTNEISMEDVSTPTPAPSHMTTSRKSSLGQSHPPIPQHSTVIQSQVQNQNQPQAQSQPCLGGLTMEMSSEMIDKLSLLDKILDSAQSAKQALLRGEEIGVSTNLGDISNHLEVASELGVGPVQTPKDTTTPNSQTSQQSASPTGNYLPSPGVQTNVTAAPSQYQVSMSSTAVPSQLNNLQMTVQPSSLLPSLPVDQNAPGSKRTINSTVPPGSKLAAEFLTSKLQAPPLVHSHSFPNGHQLPSQLTGTLPPTTPAVPSPSFIASIGAQHMPMVSSPLATIPPSRPPSPPRYTLPPQPWDGEIMSMDVNLQQNGLGNTSTQQSGQQMIERRLSTSERVDGRPIVRGRSTSVNKSWSHTAMTSSVPPSAWQSRAGSPVDDIDDEDDSDDDEPRKNKRRRSSVGADGLALDQASGGISDDIRRQLDQIFEEFLNRICSDCKYLLSFFFSAADTYAVDACDSKGEKIHQVLMPKKMQKLDESTDYRPFKFRIQAFTNAFAEDVSLSLHDGVSRYELISNSCNNVVSRRKLCQSKRLRIISGDKISYRGSILMARRQNRKAITSGMLMPKNCQVVAGYSGLSSGESLGSPIILREYLS